MYLGFPRAVVRARGDLMGLLNWLKSGFRHQPPAPRDTVSFDDQGIRLVGRDGAVGLVSWDELQAVYIETTAGGPFVEDVFFVLVGTNEEHVVPQGTIGTNDLTKRLGELPGFDHDAFCRAMCCTANNRFVCWKRENATTKSAK